MVQDFLVIFGEGGTQVLILSFVSSRRRRDGVAPFGRVGTEIGLANRFALGYLGGVPNNTAMNAFRLFTAGAALVAAFSLHSQTGPFPPTEWPATTDPDKIVHYVVTDDSLVPPGFLWSPTLSLLSGGDQATEDISIGGLTGKKLTGSFLNIADASYWDWAFEENLDILMLVYGDAALFNAEGEVRNFNFLTGSLPELSAPVGGQIPLEARNRQWNWVLFRIPNNVRASDGQRLIGTVAVDAQGATQNGGVNGGTIRMESVPGIIVRAVAFGQLGAFGEPEAVNVFASGQECDPEPETNLAGIDIDANMSDNVVVLDSGDQTVEFADDVGSEGDLRRAVRPLGTFLNFGIEENYLGLPCNEPRTVKVCVDFYDDPAFAFLDVRFGPEAFATDDQGGIGFVPAASRHLMEGSGQWIRRSWTIPAVSLFGVNANGMTAGPRFISENGQVFVSRYEIAVIRTGDHPLAGQDPLAACIEDPNICSDGYGNFVEFDLATDLRNGLDVGSSGGDQEMIVEEAGPAGDRRMAVRPAHDDGSPGAPHHYLNFSITEEALGPNSQPNAHLAICVTYYDDPALVGAQFRPEVYQTERGGSLTLGFAPTSFNVAIQGTDTWRTAYWEITDMKFIGVNQGPQAAARFFVGDKVFFSRVSYAIIRPCGPQAGVNLLEECKPPLEVPDLQVLAVDGMIQLRWPAGSWDFTLLSAGQADAAEWDLVEATPVMDGENWLVELPTSESERYFRLGL